jgi:type II secretory pathway pseudopilin PulG
MTLVELMITCVLIAALGLIIFSLLNTGTILGAKNTAVNVAHQQARTAMIQMTQNLHSAVSPLQLVDATGIPLPLNGDGSINNGPAAGISFQLLTSGPLRVVADANVGDTSVTLNTSGVTPPQAGDRLIIRTHSIEQDITAVSGAAGTRQLTLASPLTVPITATSTTHITGIITHRCSYIVVNGGLQWTGPITTKTLSTDITNPTPFSTPVTPGGSTNFRFVAAIDLSTSDANYTNRGFKAANILLNGTVPTRAQLTDGL